MVEKETGLQSCLQFFCLICQKKNILSEPVALLTTGQGGLAQLVCDLRRVGNFTE